MQLPGGREVSAELDVGLVACGLSGLDCYYAHALVGGGQSP